MIRLLLFLVSLSLITVSTYELNRRYQARQLLVLETAPLQTADTLLTQQRWQEARFLADVVTNQAELGETRRAHEIRMAADAALASVPIQARSFLHGAVSGEAQNGAALLGAMTLDLFVIGDIRDLAIQGYREIAYQDGDDLIIALSAAGLGLALLPELHWAPALLKSMKRAGALSERFTRILYKHTRYALRTGDYTPLTRVLGDVGRAARSLGPGPLSGAMQAVQTETDLARLAAAAGINPKQAYAVSSLAGQRGLRQLHKNGRNVGAVTRKLKVSSRLAKTARKSLGIIPSGILLLILLTGLGIAIQTLHFRKKPA